jgi:transcriptional regulator with XRE-family HTH domain
MDSYMQGSLAERLRLLRAKRGLTLIEAAERTGVGRVTLSDLERGRRHPVTPTLAKIAKGYDVPVEELLEEPVPSGGRGPTGFKVGVTILPQPAAEESDEERRAQDLFQRFPEEEERRKHVVDEIFGISARYGKLLYMMLMAAKESDTDTNDLDGIVGFFVTEGYHRFLEQVGVTGYMNAVLEGRVEVSPKERRFCEGLPKLISTQLEAISRVVEGASEPAPEQSGAAEAGEQTEAVWAQ